MLMIQFNFMCVGNESELKVNLGLIKLCRCDLKV